MVVELSEQIVRKRSTVSCWQVRLTDDHSTTSRSTQYGVIHNAPGLGCVTLGYATPVAHILACMLRPARQKKR